MKDLFGMAEEDKPSIGQKVSEMHHFFKLNMTGTLDAEMLQIMKKPHCGVPDKAKNYKWSTNKLTYRCQCNPMFKSHFTILC